jgi:hypothetical protein
MVGEQQLDAAAVKAIDSINRLMFAVDIKLVASNKDQTVHQRMNQIRRFERLWRQRVRRTP